MRTMLNNCSDPSGNEQVPVYRTVVRDKACSVKFLDSGEGSTVLLASYYGSGNTWMRHLIETSTGIYTGSVYTDHALYDQGRPIMSHHRSSEDLKCGSMLMYFQVTFEIF